MLWDSAKFDYWYSRQTDPAVMQKAWVDLRADEQKLYKEWRIFRKFAGIAPLDIDPRSVENCAPPEPDIRCRLLRMEHYFELGEVTDEGLARKAGISVRRGTGIFAGSFSQLAPLHRIFWQKCRKTYVTNGRPLHLLLHYSVGHHVPHKEHVLAAIAQYQDSVMRKLRKSPFSTAWLFDEWSDVVIAYVQR